MRTGLRAICPMHLPVNIAWTLPELVRGRWRGGWMLIGWRLAWSPIDRRAAQGGVHRRAGGPGGTPL